MISLEKLDRTLFEKLRLAFVAGGWLADFRSMGGDKAAFVTAQDAIRASKGAVINVYSIGTGQAKGAQAYNKVTLHRVSIIPGDVGATGLTELVSDGAGAFNKVDCGSTSYYIDYEVRIFAEKTSHERVMLETINRIFGGRQQLQAVDDSWDFTGNAFTLEMTNIQNVTSTEYFEWMMSLRVHNVFISEPVIIESGIPPLTQVDYQIDPDQYGGNDSDADTVTIN